METKELGMFLFGAPLVLVVGAILFSVVDNLIYIHKAKRRLKRIRDDSIK